MNTIERELKAFLDLDYDVTVVPDVCGTARCYLASNPELPGCMSQGETPDEAVDNLRDARALYIRSLLEDGLDVPEPRRSPAVAAVGSATP